MSVRNLPEPPSQQDAFSRGPAGSPDLGLQKTGLESPHAQRGARGARGQGGLRGETQSRMRGASPFSGGPGQHTGRVGDAKARWRCTRCDTANKPAGLPAPQAVVAGPLHRSP